MNKPLSLCWQEPFRWSASLLPIALLLLVAAWLLTRNLDKPFVGIHDWNGVEYGLHARNHLRYGLVQTKLGMVENPGQTKPQDFTFYTHYPPVFPLTLLGAAWIGRETEASYRVVAILFSLSTLIGIYFLGKIWADAWTGWLAAAMALFTPMVLYYGKLPVHEIWLVCFQVWITGAYWLWLKHSSLWSYLSLVALTILIGLIAWPGYFFIVGIFVYTLLFHRRRWRPIFCLGLLLIGLFALHLLHVKLLTGTYLGGGLDQVLWFRLNQDSSTQAAIVGFSWVKYGVQQFHWFNALFTKLLVGLAGIWICRAGYQWWRTDTLSPLDRGIFLLLLTALGYPLVFANAVFIHDYLNIYFLPFMVLSAAVCISVVMRSLDLHLFSRVVLLLSLPLAIGYDGLNYYHALQVSTHSLPGYQLGLVVQKIIAADQSVLVQAPQFGGFFGVFAAYYADRSIVFSEYPLSVWQKQGGIIREHYPYVLTVDTHLPDPALVTFFRQNYAWVKVGEYTLYRLN